MSSISLALGFGLNRFRSAVARFLGYLIDDSANYLTDDSGNKLRGVI